MKHDFSETLFQSYHKLILDYCGIDMPEDGRADLARHVEQRMAEVGARSFHQYLSLLTSKSGEELRHLTEKITNNETYFFREPAHFEVLRRVLIPDILKRKKEKRIRIWSAGCSTGEEVYTLAMILEEARQTCGDFEGRVIGTDIDRAALAVAEAGVYGRHSFRAIEPYYLKSYFKPPDARLPDCRRIDDRLKRSVQFETLNLFEDRLGEFLYDIDVIFFRNVSIYFAKSKIQTVNARLSRTLNDEGFLILGSSETLHHNFGHLKLIEIDHVFLYQKKPDTSVARPVPDAVRSIMPGASVVKAPDRRPSSRSHTVRTKTTKAAEETVRFDQVFSGFKDGRYAQCLTWIQKMLHGTADPSERMPLLVLRTHIHIAQENLAAAHRDCRDILKDNPLHAEGFFLEGLIRYYEKDYKSAADSLRKAIFLNNDLALAHFHLASVFLNSGADQDARREYKNTIKVLEQKMDGSLSFAALGYSSEYLINSCKQHLKILA